jgi:membrane protein involved in colicin uptake
MVLMVRKRSSFAYTVRLKSDLEAERAAEAERVKAVEEAEAKANAKTRKHQKPSDAEEDSVMYGN